MSSFINKAVSKVEAALDKNSNKNESTHSSNYGPTGTAVGNNRTHDQYGGTHGAGGLDSSNTYGSANPGYDNPRSTNAGGHNLMNKLDPSYDSDRGHRNDHISHVGGVGNTQQYGDNYSQTGNAGGMSSTDTGYGRNTATAPIGYAGTSTNYDNTTSSSNVFQRSNLANKLDPRHDSSSTSGGYDDTPVHNATTGGYGGTHTDHSRHSGHTGHTGHTRGHGGHTGTSTYDDTQSNNSRGHNSNLMNKIDPRYNSDGNHRNDQTSRVGGYGDQHDDYGHSAGIQGGYTGNGMTGGYGQGTQSDTTGVTGNYGNVGHHSTTGTTSGYNDSQYSPGSGNTSGTTGPHKSNLLNKIDPRVKNDLDSSRTYGDSQTYR